MDREDYCTFLLNICATQTERSVLVASIRVLSALFYDRRVVFDTLLALLSSSDEAVQVAAMEGLARSSRFTGEMRNIFNVMALDASLRVRRAFVIGAARGLPNHGKVISKYRPLVEAFVEEEAIDDAVVDRAAVEIIQDSATRLSNLREAILLLIKRLDMSGFGIRNDLDRYGVHIPVPSNRSRREDEES